MRLLKPPQFISINRKTHPSIRIIFSRLLPVKITSNSNLPHIYSIFFSTSHFSRISPSTIQETVPVSRKPFLDFNIGDNSMFTSNSSFGIKLANTNSLANDESQASSAMSSLDSTSQPLQTTLVSVFFLSDFSYFMVEETAKFDETTL